MDEKCVPTNGIELAESYETGAKKKRKDQKEFDEAMKLFGLFDEKED